MPSSSTIGVARKKDPWSNLTFRSPSSALSGPVPFSETPALVRTQAGMAMFLEMDQVVDEYFNSTSNDVNPQSLISRLKELLTGPQDPEEEDGETDVKEENDESVALAAIGNKRKMLVLRLHLYILHCTEITLEMAWITPDPENVYATVPAPLSEYLSP